MSSDHTKALSAGSEGGRKSFPPAGTLALGVLLGLAGAAAGLAVGVLLVQSFRSVLSDAGDVVYLGMLFGSLLSLAGLVAGVWTAANLDGWLDNRTRGLGDAEPPP
jgi:hypothetical protein